MGRANERGMMLMEVVVAVAILAMMTTAVWSTFSSTVKAMDEVGKVQDRYAMVRTAMNRMGSEAQMAFLSFNRPSSETRHFTLFEGREDFGSASLTFSAFSHLRMRKHANESDQALIQYFLAPDDDDSDRTHLYRRESRRLTGDLPEQMDQFEPAYVLLEDVKELEFKFWDPVEARWISQWQTTQRDQQADRLPNMIRIRIGIVPLEGDGDDLEYFSTSVQTVIREKIDLSKK
jgi:general secretion pathway protein J